MRDWKLGVAVCVLAFLVGAPAQAQDVEPGAGRQEGDDYFRRDRNVSVNDRRDAVLDELGWRAGSFWIHPELSLSVGYNDNVTASEDDARTSAVYAAQFDVDARSNWNRHALGASLSVPIADYEEWTTTDVIANVDARYDATGAFSLNAGGEYGALHEPLSFRAAGQEVREPLEYEAFSAHLGFLSTLNRLRFSGQVRFGEFDYHDGELLSGLPLEADDRDFTERAVNLRVEYALSELTSLFVSATANERDHVLAPPVVATEEDSKGYDVLTGANFDLTGLARGELGFGYFSQSFDEPGTDDVKGFAARALLELYPDELVTLTMGVERTVKDAPVEEASAPGAISYVATNATAALQYEFRRNLLFSARSAYNAEDYDQIDREDRRLNVSLNAEYDLNRRTAFFLTFEHETQDSSGADAGRTYEVNIASVGVRLRR